jgi:hypothetical protein
MKDKIIEALKKATALHRIGNPKEFAEAVVGMATCTYLTGNVLRLDGGIRFPMF